MKNTRTTFDEFLQAIFDKQFTGTKDQFEDAFDVWSSNLDVQELIDYADVYGDTCYNAGKNSDYASK